MLRIGSDPQCDICLPSAELAPHALTLEFRDGNYRAYNRSASPVNVGATVVQPGANAVWHADETIQLPGDLRLALEVDGDPRPTPRPDSHFDDGFARRRRIAADGRGGGRRADEAAAKKSKSSLIQMAIIGVCVLALAGLLDDEKRRRRRDGRRRPADVQRARPGVAHQGRAPPGDRPPPAIRPGRPRPRQRPQLAHERFVKLRDQLVNHVDSLAGEEKTDAERVLSYVEYRLGQLVAARTWQKSAETRRKTQISPLPVTPGQPLV